MSDKNKLKMCNDSVNGIYKVKKPIDRSLKGLDKMKPNTNTTKSNGQKDKNTSSDNNKSNGDKG